MNTRKRLATLYGAMAVIVAPGLHSAWAADPLPMQLIGAAQLQPDWEGRVEDINSSNNSIIVNDRVFLLQAGTIYHGTRGGRTSLSKGMSVRIKSTLGANGVSVASEIWVQ